MPEEALAILLDCVSSMHVRVPLGPPETAGIGQAALVRLIGHTRQKEEQALPQKPPHSERVGSVTRLALEVIQHL